MSLPVVGTGGKKVRASKTSRWRAGVLILVHVLILAHIVHWLVAGKTISPVEPSEAMYALNYGHINAGFLFFLLAILVTALLGRFFCGWGCHLVAYQDFCAWLLKKAGIKPKAFRSRLLVLAPLALAIYMFIWPTAYRWWVGAPPPHVVNDLITSDFWKTFPGPVVAILTFAVCGFVIVYVLGAKGFCTYGCPYGGFFGLVDGAAVGRIRVTDACEHCGHCTAVCTSNVKVHEEVALYGMVVDPGCMKCMDCVSVCPNDALYWGIGRPAAGAKPASPRKPTPFDFTLGEELLMVVVGLWGLLAYRGLYGHVPLLMAMGMAALFAYLVMKSIRLMRDANVRLQNLSLKKGGKLSPAGRIFAGAMAVVLALTVHSTWIQWEGARGRRLYAGLNIGATHLPPGTTWWAQATPDRRSSVDRAIAHLERADRWGFLSTDVFLNDLVNLYFARDDAARAETIARRMVALYPRNPIPRVRLADLLERRGALEEAVEEYRRALEVNPANEVARSGLCQLLTSMDRTSEALAVFAGHILLPKDADWVLRWVGLVLARGDAATAEQALERMTRVVPRNARVHWLWGRAAAESGDAELAELRMKRALELDPALAEAHYDLGQLYIAQQRMPEAIAALQQCIRHAPAFVDAHYNLGVMLMMSGRPGEAVPYAREAVRLAPGNPLHHQFLIEVLTRAGDREGAKLAREQFERQFTP